MADAGLKNTPDSSNKQQSGSSAGNASATQDAKQRVDAIVKAQSAQKDSERPGSLVDESSAQKKRIRQKPGGAYSYASRPPDTGKDFLDTEPTLQPIDKQKSAEYQNYQDKYDPRKQKLKTPQERKQEQRTNTATKKQVSRKLRRIGKEQARQTQKKKRGQKQKTQVKGVSKALSAPLKLTVRITHAGFAAAQIWFSLFVIAGMGAGGILAGILMIVGLSSQLAELLFYGSFILAIAFGWMKLLFLSFLLLIAGTKPLNGTNMEIKIVLFLVAFVTYSLPVLQMFPVSILWTEYVFRHPK